MAAKPRVESSEPKFRKIWSSVIGCKKLFEAHNEGESEVESRLETNVKRQVESKVQTCVGDHESHQRRDPPLLLKHHSICTTPAPNPRPTSLSLISANLLVTSSLTLPGPLHSTSAAAQALGHSIPSKLTLSANSPHKRHSPPTKRCFLSAEIPQKGS